MHGKRPANAVDLRALYADRLATLALDASRDGFVVVEHAALAAARSLPLDRRRQQIISHIMHDVCELAKLDSPRPTD